MVCPHCKAENPDGAKRCTSCGKRLRSRRKVALMLLILIAVAALVALWLRGYYVGPADQLLDKALAPYNQAQSFRGHATGLRLGTIAGAGTTALEWDLSLAYQRPNKMQAKLSSPAEDHYLVCDGSKCYDSVPLVGSVVIYDGAAGHELWDVVGFAMGIATQGGWRGSVVAGGDPRRGLVSVKKAGVSFVGGRPVQVLALEYQPNAFYNPTPVSARLWLKPGGSGIVREEVSQVITTRRRTALASAFRLTWDKQEINPSLAPSLFTFTKPANVRSVGAIGPKYWDVRKTRGKGG